MTELLGLKVFWDAWDIAKLVLRLAIDLFFVWALMRFVYLRLYKRWDLAFSGVMLNVITFAVCMLLRKVPVDIGFALGLFAVFGILRYRTEPITARDLTYLFVVLGIGILNAVANKKISLAEVIFINTAIVGITALLEYMPFSGRVDSRQILYDRLELLKPGRSEELREDLASRLGIKVVSCQINSIDLLRDTARLIVTLEPATVRRDRPERDDEGVGKRACRAAGDMRGRGGLR